MTQQKSTTDPLKVQLWSKVVSDDYQIEMLVAGSGTFIVEVGNETFKVMK